MGRLRDPVDTQEFYEQIRAEPEKYYCEMVAYPPKVKIRNDIWPRPWEVYNCTSCRRGKELPQNKLSKEDYHYWCRWDGRTHIGPKFTDIFCLNWDRKIERPKHGYFPGIEEGPYKPEERR